MLFRRFFPALFSSLLAVVSASAFPSASNLYIPPASQPFIENPGEIVTTLNVSSGSLADAQSQLDAARAANPSAIIVLNLTGTYAVSTAPLTLPSHTCLVLGTHTVIQAAPGATATALIQVTSQNHVSIAGGTFIGNGASLNAIAVATSDRVNIDKVVVQNCAADGIVMTGNGNAAFDNELTVARSEISGCTGNGISIANGTQDIVVDNFCHNNGGAGIFFAAARGTGVNNRCVSNLTGIVAHGSDSAITDNTVDSNPTGIALDGSSNNNICSSNIITNSASVGLSDAGTNDTLFQNSFSGNAANLSASGTGANVIAWRGNLSAAGQNYFYPPLIDDQHALATIMNGKGRTDLTVGAATIDAVQTQYDAAVAANPGNVIVLHLTGATYTVGANPLTLSSNTCVLLSGTIQINSSTSASTAIRADAQAFISISGGKIDGGGRTGKNAIYITNSHMIWVDKMTVGNLGAPNPRVGGSDVVHFSGGSTPYLFSRNLVSGGAARGVWTQLSNQKFICTDNECTNVNQDGVDCDSSTYSALVKFNNCHDNVRYGVFFEQGDSYCQAIANICTGNGRGVNVYNNALPATRVTRYNTVACNFCDSNSNAIRSGSTDVGSDGTTTTTSHNFIFNNRATNSSGIGLECDPTGVENYYYQNIATGNGTDIRTSGNETFFNPATPGLVAASPTFTPAGGNYIGTQMVTISSATSIASIRYTTDGSAPSETNGTLYAGPIAVSGPTTLQAIAYAPGYADSDVTSATYTIQVAPPVFSLPSGVYSGAQTVTLTTASSGAAIRYTTDGSTPTSTTGTLYSGPVNIADTTTLKAIAYAAGLPDSTVTTATYTITASPPVATPTFAPDAGTYTTVQSVTISSTTAGASIRYTTDGSLPTSSTGTLYSGPITVASTTTLNAIAYEAGLADSAVASASYMINLPITAAPTFAPAPGTYTSAQTVTISTTTSGASIRYTTDGSTPTSTTGTPYTNPVILNGSVTLKAIAFAPGLADSAITSGVYTIAIQVAAPVISPNGGDFPDPQTVTLSSATTGASIRYTTDGSPPTTTTGTLYSAPFKITSTSTINAIAFKTGQTNSTISNSYFAIGLSFEAENLQFNSGDTTASITTDTTASGGAYASDYQYVTLNASGVGAYIEFTLQDIPAGTYNLQMRYKSHPTNRGILQLTVDGVPLGANLDQRAAKATYSINDFGTVHFGAFGDHVVRLTVVGKNAVSTLYNITADRFDLVPDKTAPVITVPAAITAEATSAAGAAVTFSATATDDKDGPVPVTLTPASGSVFALGTTTVTATAHDFAGNTSSKTFTVTVHDTTAPVIQNLTPSLTTLWPANHRMMSVSLTADVTDAVDPAPHTSIISVSSNEPITGTSNGDIGPDWQITGDLTLDLRAERASAGSGRVYTITVECRDASGNAATKTVTVNVPKTAP